MTQAMIKLLLKTLLIVSRPLCVTMDRINFNYSMKNISIPSIKAYQIEFIHSMEKFVFNARWRAFNFLNPFAPNRKETYRFNTTNPAPFVKELKVLEDALCDLAKNIEFRKVNNNFQRKLKEDLNKLKNEERVIVAADKTVNHYAVEKSNFKEHLNKSVTNDYKIANKDFVHQCSVKEKRITDKLEISERVYSTNLRSAFVTFKDHKPNFPNNTKCRLLDPTKPELGKISKQILSKVVAEVKVKSGLHQWKNSDSVIDWFKNLQGKKKMSFIQFDICDFYPSITPNLLQKALEYAESFVKISDQDKEIIFQSRKSFLFHDGKAWVKRESEDFDVAMGSFDSAEISDICGLYILSLLPCGKVSPGIYRDDGLIASTLTPRQNELLKKKICKIFSDIGLRITIEANLKTVDFLDITLDLTSEVFKPYMLCDI